MLPGGKGLSVETTARRPGAQGVAVEQHPDRAMRSGSMHWARLALLFLQRRVGADALAWVGGLFAEIGRAHV